MSGRSFQIVAAVVLILAALTPLFECFDHWDRNAGPANDTEIHLTMWFVGAGIGLVLAPLLRYTPCIGRAMSSIDRIFRRLCPMRPMEYDGLNPTESPPIIPLRI